MTYLEPGERDVGMVFQDYVFYPHMTIFESIVFPLEINRKMRLSKDEISQRVHSVAKIVGIEELLDRKVTQLSSALESGIGQGTSKGAQNMAHGRTSL